MEKIVLDPELLRRMYIDEENPMKEIGKCFGVSKTYIKRRLINFNIPIRSFKWSKEEEKYLIENAGNIKAKQMAVDLKRPNYCIQQKAVSLGVSLNVVYPGNIKLGFFDEWNEYMAYILGFIYADGNLETRKNNKGHYRITITSADYEILDKISKLLEHNGKIMLGKYSKNFVQYGHFYRMQISGKENYERILELGVVPRKSKVDHTVPDMPSEVFRHFVRGFFDGDGCITSRSVSCPVIIFTGHQIFLDNLVERLSKELDEDFSARSYKGKGCISIYYYGTRALKILDFMYQNADIYLARKFERFLNVKRR